MIKQCVCSLCGKKFNYKDYGDDYERECFKHEVIDHLNGDKKCKRIINDTINDLNQKYKLSFSMIDYKFNPYYDDYIYSGTDEIEISFKLKTSSEIFITLIVKCTDNTINLTKEMIISEIDMYYIKESKKKIIGVVKFEDWCGGHGADDYIINGMYLRDIMKELEGKKVSIQILKD